MRARLLRDTRPIAHWITNGPFYPAGAIVPVIPASNITQDGDAIRFWIDTPELQDDPYGMGLYDGDFEILPEGK